MRPDQPTTTAADPADRAVLVRCDDCDLDIPVWPKPSYPLVPKVEHHDDGTHALLWPERNDPTRFSIGGPHGYCLGGTP